MVLPLVINSGAAAAPTGQGWSRFDIGCCCNNSGSLCGCINVDNYEDDFSTGPIDSGWAADPDLMEVTGGRVELHQDTQTEQPAAGRCLVLPDMAGKKIVVEFRYLSAAIDYDKLSFLVILALQHTETGGGGFQFCVSHANFRTRIFNSFFNTITGQYTGLDPIYTDPPHDILITMEVERIEPTPGDVEYECRWYIDGVLQLTQTNNVTVYNDEVATLGIVWGTREDIGTSGPVILDDFVFGIYDV